MNRDPADTNPNLPPWLRGQPLPPRPDTDAPTPQAASSAASESEGIPDWLRTEAGDAISRPQPIPDWLQDRPEPAVSTGNEVLPDWLRDQAGDPASSTSEVLPDWLRESEPRAETLHTEPGDETIPDWLRGLSEAPAPASEPAQPIAADGASVPDWLLAMAEETPTVAGPEAGSANWVHEPAALADTTNDSTNDWLDQTANEPVQAAPEAPIIEAPAVDTWFSQISPDQIRAAMESHEEPLTATPFSFDVGDTLAQAAPSEPASWFGDDADTATSAWFAPPPTVPDASSNELTDDDAPAWLKDASQPTSKTDVTLQPSTAEPAWLRNDAASLDTLAAGPTETPVWLHDQEPAGIEQPALPNTGATTPDWLRDDAAQGGANTAPHDDVPAWLRADQKPAPPLETPSMPDWATPVAPDPEPRPATNDTQAWLSEAAPTDSSPIEAPNLPVWLHADQSPAPVAPQLPVLPGSQPIIDDVSVPPWLRDERGIALPTASAPGEQDLPPWLKGAALTRAADAPVPEAPVSPTTGWFDDAVSGTDPLDEASENEFLGTTDLPAWLRRPQAQKAVVETADSRALDWLTKLGAPEEDLGVPSTTTRLAPPLNPVRTSAQIQAVALLQQLATAPIAASSQLPTAEPHSFWKRALAERLLYLLLLLALLIGPFVPALAQPLAVPPNVPAAQQLYDQLRMLGPSDTVLIGYDWDARRVAELRPMEDAVIAELIARKVKLVLMSTDPQGSLLLYDLRERLNQAGYQPGGEDYILLGYQPGGEFALRSLAQNVRMVLRSDFQGADMSTSPLATGRSTGTGKQLASLNDFSMVMLLADDQVDVQGWMEQIHQSAPTTRFAMLMTAEAAPAADPYVRQPSVYGLTGTTGALAFMALRGGDTKQLGAITTQLRLGLVSFVLLLVLGGLLASIVHGVRRRQR